jgi:hypothetical protein
MKQFFENVAYGSAIGFVVMVICGLIAMSLGGTFRGGAAANYIPITFQSIFQFALVGSISLGFCGAVIDFVSPYLTTKKSDADDQ